MRTKAKSCLERIFADLPGEMHAQEGAVRPRSQAHRFLPGGEIGQVGVYVRVEGGKSHR